jgi:hypothetical protein
VKHAPLVLLALVAVALGGALLSARGNLAGERAAIVALQDSLARQAARVDTVYQIQRDTFVVRRQRWDTARVEVERWKHDTVEVVRYVALADSTIRACSLALQSCDDREALRIGQLNAWERRWETREKPRPPALVWVERGLIFWAGTRVR